MKSTNRLIAIATLVCALGTAAYAGDISTPGYSQPNPPPPSSSQSAQSSPTDSTSSGNLASTETTTSILEASEADLWIDLLVALAWMS